jgi:MFS superfamily sulfate permease-like transporter
LLKRKSEVNMIVFVWAFWLIVWLSGAVLVYFLGVRMDEDYPWNWTNDKRGTLVCMACCSWVLIGVCAAIGVVVVACMGLGWLANRYIVPTLKKLEPKVGSKSG